MMPWHIRHRPPPRSFFLLREGDAGNLCLQDLPYILKISCTPTLGLPNLHLQRLGLENRNLRRLHHLLPLTFPYLPNSPHDRAQSDRSRSGTRPLIRDRVEGLGVDDGDLREGTWGDLAVDVVGCYGGDLVDGGGLGRGGGGGGALSLSEVGEVGEEGGEEGEDVEVVFF